jgi:hypothetical protein
VVIQRHPRRGWGVCVDLGVESDLWGIWHEFATRRGVENMAQRLSKHTGFPVVEVD